MWFVVKNSWLAKNSRGIVVSGRMRLGYHLYMSFSSTWSVWIWYWSSSSFDLSYSRAVQFVYNPNSRDKNNSLVRWAFSLRCAKGSATKIFLYLLTFSPFLVSHQESSPMKILVLTKICISLCFSFFFFCHIDRYVKLWH